MDSSEFFGTDAPTTDPQGYDQHGRYLLNADGKGDKAYTRATTLAKTLDNGRGLAIWETRKVAKGVAMSPALTARAAVAALDDKDTWREITAQAEVKSGGDEKRELGSAFHELHERVPHMSDEEYAAVPHELRVTYERYRAELARLGITEVMTEGTCVNTAIGTAGKFDAIFRLADGRLVIGDRKTGRVVEYPHSPAVQFATYANADVLIEWDENGAASHHPMPDVSREIAIVVDITIGDEQTAAAHVYEVDIAAGWYGALLAGKVRRWRNRKDLIMPYHPEFPPADRASSAAAVEPVLSGVPSGHVVSAGGEPPRATPEQRAEFAAELGYGTTAQPVEVAHGPTANAYTAPSATQHMREIQAAADEQRARVEAKLAQPAGHPAFSSSQQKNIMIGADGNEVVMPAAVPTPPSSDLPADAEALLDAFKTKAQMQHVLFKVDPTANRSRTRANLAKDIVNHPNWPNRRAEFLTDPVARVQEASDEAAEIFSPVVSNAPGPVPPDPEPNYPTLADAAGNQADNPFASPAPAVVEEPIEDQLLRRIGEAAAQADLAQVWEDARDAGLGWPPRLNQAATIKAKSFTN